MISTRKRGIELAEGEIVGFVDSDDWIEPIMYERLVQCMEENECDLVTSGIYRDYADGSRKEWYDQVLSSGRPRQIPGEQFAAK